MEVQQTREEHRQSLEEKHQYAWETLEEHFRMAAKEQREQDHRQFEQQIQFLQNELRVAQNTVNTKQQELIISNKHNAGLAGELKHTRSEIHRVEQEIRSLNTAKEQLGVAELKNQQLLSQLVKTREREVELINDNKYNGEKLQEATAEVQRLEAELIATKSVISTHEQILQLLSPTQNPARETINNQTSPSNSVG